jgi:hypothetical protein
VSQPVLNETPKTDLIILSNSTPYNQEILLKRQPILCEKQANIFTAYLEYLEVGNNFYFYILYNLTVKLKLKGTLSAERPSGI